MESVAIASVHRERLWHLNFNIATVRKSSAFFGIEIPTDMTQGIANFAKSRGNKLLLAVIGDCIACRLDARAVCAHGAFDNNGRAVQSKAPSLQCTQIGKET